MVARGTDPAERCAAGGAGQLFVPVDDPGAAVQPELLIARFGVRQQTCRQAITGGVGFGDGGVETGVADDLQQRAEQLFVGSIGHRADIDNARRQQRRAGLRLAHFQQGQCAVGEQIALRVEQAACSLQRNHRTHERRRLLIERTGFDSSADANQSCQQGITPVAFGHQQTTRTGAALAGRNESRLNDGVHRCIDVLNLIDNQRVVTAHFQRKDLVRPTGELLMQRIAGPARPGEEQAVDTRIGRQRDTGFATALQQVQDPGRQPGFDPALDGQFSDFRCQFAGLEQHHIARQQGRDDMAVGQMPGKVVRPEHGDHAVRLVAQYRSGVAQWPALFAGSFAIALHRDGNLVDHAGHFGR
ncbi:hypothetical protein ALO75_200051 [Pseudomonas syringae pv. coryli]|uniref:Energy transducer TonB n=1 Tax=Pseudomonas syringae pv. coryli TaxID=317659 RepID=A0A0P9N1P7_9PSED|nr:hypothetical protein ALO75_200051 [Pseudomonas syringae pv. coryli]